MILDIDQVAELASCSKQQVLELVASGAMPAPKAITPSLVRWCALDINEWAASGFESDTAPTEDDFRRIRVGLICVQENKDRQALDAMAEAEARQK